MALLYRLRVASAAISAAQTVLIVAVLLLGFVITAGGAVVVAAAAAAVLLELVDFMLARRAVRLLPPDAASEAYGAKPLRASDRRIVISNIVGGIAVCAFLVAVMPARTFHGRRWLEALALLAVTAPPWLSQLRVLRNNSWLAVSRIPKPTRTHAEP